MTVKPTTMMVAVMMVETARTPTPRLFPARAVIAGPVAPETPVTLETPVALEIVVIA